MTSPASRPSREELTRYALQHGLRLSERELADVSAVLSAVRRLDELEPPSVPLQFPDRDLGRAPRAGEDPDNAVVRFCEVGGARTGALAGMRVGVKDTILLAGVLMGGGTWKPRAFVPSEDAVVVERLLAGGAVIRAKTNVNVTSDDGFGITRNPRDASFWSGGSSSGSAAAVAGGLVDAGLGADQGGSLRVPAAWCGLVGMKATHGLVPTYGLLYWDHTLDHVGPITGTVADNAAMLEVLAGGDWRDPQSGRADPRAGSYADTAELGIEGMRFGAVREALSPAGCGADALTTFRRAERALRRLGAEVVPVHVPLWNDAPAIWLATLVVGLTLMDASLGQGYGHLGRVDLDLLGDGASEHLHETRELPLGGRAFPLVLEHLRQVHNGAQLGRAQNLRLELSRQIDSALGRVDLLITPTTPTGPPELRDVRAGDRIDWALVNTPGSPLANCCALNLSGHPALTMPSGLDRNAMPLGLQIIGPRFDERAVYRAAFSLEGAIAP